jgi:hypothetical protein
MLLGFISVFAYSIFVSAQPGQKSSASSKTAPTGEPPEFFFCVLCDEETVLFV